MFTKQFWLRFFTWWNGANLNTHVFTNKHGELVGHDEFGNAYYRMKGGGIDPALGFERRWVIYNGVAEASMTPPGWNGWLHQTVDTPPSEEAYAAREWEKPHLGNLTGTLESLSAARVDHGHWPPAGVGQRLSALESERLIRPRHVFAGLTRQGRARRPEGAKNML